MAAWSPKLFALLSADAVILYFPVSLTVTRGYVQRTTVGQKKGQGGIGNSDWLHYTVVSICLLSQGTFKLPHLLQSTSRYAVSCSNPQLWKTGKGRSWTLFTDRKAEAVKSPTDPEL